MSMENIMSALVNIGPLKQVELMQFLRISSVTAFRQIKALKEAKKIHITRFERQPSGKRGSPSPVYAAGRGVDAVKPEPKTQQQRNREYKERHGAIIAARKKPTRRIALGMWAGLGALPGREVAQSCGY